MSGPRTSAECAPTGHFSVTVATASMQAGSTPSWSWLQGLLPEWRLSRVIALSAIALFNSALLPYSRKPTVNFVSRCRMNFLGFSGRRVSILLDGTCSLAGGRYPVP
jgi:hypothetical protein